MITLDLLGHGRSDRPRDMWRYSMSFFGEQTIGLLDHLELDEAVIMGTSLGANTALEAASVARERVRGMVIEMPVLDGAMVACGVAFLPLLLATKYGTAGMRVVQRLASAVPRGALPHLADIGLDTIRQDPAPSAAVLEGLFFGRIAPNRRERRTFEMPALVIGHTRDPVHPFSDAGMLADELPNGRLLEASSLLELRLAPKRLTEEIALFIDECWRDEPAVTPEARASVG